MSWLIFTLRVDSFCCDALGVKALFLSRLNYLRTSNVVPNGALLACDFDLHCVSNYAIGSISYCKICLCPNLIQGVPDQGMYSS